MGRLDNIIARNRDGRRPTERVVVSMMFGLVVLLILGLAVFTDLGTPPVEPPPPAPARDPGRVDGVLLRSAPRRPAPPAAAPAKPATSPAATPAAAAPP